MQLVEKAREERARLALGMGGNQARDVSLSPSAAAGVSAVPHGQAVSSLATPGEAPTELPASYTEGRASVADSGVELQSKKSDKSVGDARRAAEQLEMQDLQANGVTSQDFEAPETDKNDKKENLTIDTRGENFPLPVSPESLVLISIPSVDHSTTSNSEDLPPGFEVADKAQGQTIKKHVPKTTTLEQDGPTTPTSPNSLASPISPSKGTASSARLAALSKALNAGALTEIEAAIEDESLIDDFKPHMLHRAHKPCRKLALP